MTLYSWIFKAGESLETDPIASIDIWSCWDQLYTLKPNMHKDYKSGMLLPILKVKVTCNILSIWDVCITWHNVFLCSLSPNSPQWSSWSLFISLSVVNFPVWVWPMFLISVTKLRPMLSMLPILAPLLSMFLYNRNNVFNVPDVETNVVNVL